MRLIDADGLKMRILAFCTAGKTTFLSVEGIVTAINHTDTMNAVPVVRCRECKHAYHDNYGYFACAESGAMLCPNEDDYCSRGERKES